MPRVLGYRKDRPRVAVADDSGLIYSDDYRSGWKSGFEGVGCEVKVFDISGIRRAGNIQSPYSSAAKGFPKMCGQQIWRWKPDVVWCHHGRAASDEFFLRELKGKGVKVAVYLCDEPYEVGETARYSSRFTHVFTMDPCTIRIHQLSRRGRENVFYLPPAVDPDLFTPRPYSDRSTPAFFLGNAELPPRASWLRIVEQAIDGADIRFWKDKKGRPVAKGSKQWVPLEAVPFYYANCIVGLNVHRSPWISQDCFQNRVLRRHRRMATPGGITLCAGKPKEWGTGFWNDANAPAAHVNPRFFEMAACGTCVVSDAHRYELTRMFPMAPRAQDEKHFLQLVHHYVIHPEEAEEIGQACRSQILKRHTYRHRAAEALIRLGLGDVLEGSLATSLGERQEYLTPQDFNEQGIELSWGATGHLERWSPAYGKSMISGSGSLKEASSVVTPPPWL
jgi:hypothetical protein